VPAIAALHVLGWNASQLGVESPPLELRLQHWSAVIQGLDDPDQRLSVAFLDADLIGFVHVRALGFPGGARRGQLKTLYVRPDHWGSGLAAQLMERGLAHLRRRGFSDALLYVAWPNRRARAFYARHGWHPTAESVWEPVSNRSGLRMMRYERSLVEVPPDGQEVP
jgi:ribosomal protein S18 acetylase RimI-like enzyme